MDDTEAHINAKSRPLAAISDDDLLRRLAEILAQSRRVETDLVAHIAEVDERRLWAREAFHSMFAYCTEALHLSEAEAYLRVAAARASREHPMLLVMLGDGRLHLSGIAKLAPHLTGENREALLRRATHRSKRQIEELIAEIAPREDMPALVRKLPVRGTPPTVLPLEPGLVRPSHPCPSPQGGGGWLRPGSGDSEDAAPTGMSPLAPGTPSGMGRFVTPPVVRPLAPGRYSVRFTASAGFREKLERLRALMRSQVPDGDLGAILEEAVTEKLERLEAHRFATTRHPRKDLSETDTSSASRRVPSAVRRAVRARDGNQCRYSDASGRRCKQRDRLEYHHRHPFGLGGDHRPENISLMCRAHNAYLAEHDYGREAVARRRGTHVTGTPAVASARSMARPASTGPPGS